MQQLVTAFTKERKPPFIAGGSFRSISRRNRRGESRTKRPGGLEKFSRNTTQGVKFGVQAIAVFVGLFWVMPGPSFAYAQSEIDPDHFDSPNTEPIAQPRTADSKVTELRYDGTFSLPYSVLCSGKKLAAGKYSISFRFDGKVGRATLNQKGHAIEIAGVVQTQASKQRDEVVVVENDKIGRTLSVVRISGVDFVIDPKLLADPSADRTAAHAGKTLLTVIVPNEIANRAPSLASPKP
jgi:hypothetical protein